jgi:hypothetical protein
MARKTNATAPQPYEALAAELARELKGEIVLRKGYARVKVDGTSVVCPNRRKNGAAMDFLTRDIASAPAKLKKGIRVRGSHSMLTTTGDLRPTLALARWIVEQHATPS